MKKIKIGFLFSFLAIPVVSFAQAENLLNLVETVGEIVRQLIPIVFSLILLGFFWGLVKYIFNAGDEEAKAHGKRIMVGGIIALFVAASVWGIVIFLQETLGVDDVSTVPTPRVPQ